MCVKAHPVRFFPGSRSSEAENTGGRCLRAQENMEMPIVVDDSTAPSTAVLQAAQSGVSHRQIRPCGVSILWSRPEGLGLAIRELLALQRSAR